MNAAATISPIHSSGVLRNLHGVICVKGSAGGTRPHTSGTKACAYQPIKRNFRKLTEFEVLKAIFSTAQIANIGITAHKKVARRA